MLIYIYGPTTNTIDCLSVGINLSICGNTYVVKKLLLSLCNKMPNNAPSKHINHMIIPKVSNENTFEKTFNVITIGNKSCLYKKRQIMLHGITKINHITTILIILIKEYS